MPYSSMKFNPGKRVTFVAGDGTEYVAKPFFYSNGEGAGLCVELVTEEGDLLHCVDGAKDVYSLGDSETLVQFKTSLAG